MELINWFIDLFGSLLDPLVEPLARDISYRAGFISGFLTSSVTLAVIGYLANQFLSRWNAVLQFFRHTSGPPAPSQGPRPIDMLIGCILSAVWLLVAIGIVIAGVAVVANRTVGGRQ